jgi:uncharacterized protein with HEPN domain
MNERDRSYLDDMLSYARDAIDLLGHADATSLAADKRSRYAVIRAVEVVGEAAAKVSEEARAALPAIAWRQAIGMRNVLIHGYQGLDIGLVVETVRKHFPGVVTLLEQALGEPPE